MDFLVRFKIEFFIIKIKIKMICEGNIFLIVKGCSMIVLLSGILYILFFSYLFYFLIIRLV